MKGDGGGRSAPPDLVRAQDAARAAGGAIPEALAAEIAICTDEIAICTDEIAVCADGIAICSDGIAIFAAAGVGFGSGGRSASAE